MASFFPDTQFDYEHGILINVPGFTEQDKLDRFERFEATRAIVNLQVHPVEGRFDAAHYRKIHAAIFGRIYPWAGEFRCVNMSRPGSYPFAAVEFMQASLERTLASLAAENRLQDLDADDFAQRSAYFLGELNSIHPFREGNGRTQRELIRQLAVDAGHLINWSRVPRAQMYEASFESHNLGRNAAFARLIRIAIEPGGLYPDSAPRLS